MIAWWKLAESAQAKEFAHTLDVANGQAVAVDFYNQTVSKDGSTQTLATAASADKNKTGGVIVSDHSVASGFYPYEPGGVKSIDPEHALTLINGSCPGFHNGVVIERTECYKANLSGGGLLDSAAITGDHDCRITDYTNVIVTEMKNEKED